MKNDFPFQPLLKVAMAAVGAMLLLCTALPLDLRAAKPGNTSSVRSTKKSLYICDDGQSFTLESSPEEDCLILTMEGKPIKLPRVVSGSGAKYSNGKTTVWLKGTEAVIEVNGKIVIKNCRRQD